jgi:hypothetical protein
MQFPQKSSILRGVGVVVAAIAIPQVAADAVSPPQSWYQQRNVGGPLDGYWHSGSGCFESENVFLHKGDRQYVSRRNVAFMVATDVEQHFDEGHLVVEKRTVMGLDQPWRQLRAVYRDHGSRLVLTQVYLDGQSHSPDQDTIREGSLYLCDADNLWSRLQLLWRDPFRRNETRFFDIEAMRERATS